MGLAPKKLIFHSSSSASASVGSDGDDAPAAAAAVSKISTLQLLNQADQKQPHAVLEKTQQQEDDSTCVPHSKTKDVLLKENQTAEAGETAGDEPALKKIGEQEDSNSNSVGPQKINTMDEDDAISEAPASTALDKISKQRVHNQADQQKHSEAALEKTQEPEDDHNSDSNSKAQEIAPLDKNQTTEAEEKGVENAAPEKTREQASSYGYNFESLQKDKAIMVVEPLKPTENPLESNKLTDIQETNRKKPLAFYGHIFTDDDVIVLLQGMIDFKSMHGDKNMTDFYFFIKDKLSTQFTKIQITEKFRRLRKKFVGNFKKSAENGGSRDFSNPHDSIVFELSDKLWGNDGCDKKLIVEINEKTRKRRRVELGSRKEDKKQKGTAEDKFDIDMELKYPLVYPSLNQNIGFIAPDMLKKNWTLKGSTNSRYSGAEWEKLMIKEVELYCKKLDLMKEMTGAVLRSLKG
ncbi:unnamed protein product [Fraxinus pennsylvanica]|uniref:Glabrous enhancer-binding protein-like DBD domain-containing protein n=1 Tax=Fraxinus pennsylvanica TaxID=56036 RepID=A0AAD2A9F0_9LAMI|nr:unnamed protein product [Fraxinus pennsylvanica]